MKKGLTLALGTIVLAWASVSGYANAPIISNVPDVVISDQEDNDGITGATVDINFFRYLNAFNIMAYTQDDDTTPTSLVWGFQEDANGTNKDLSINGKTELSDAEVTGAASAWTNKIVGSGSGNSFLWSFRNILWSPPNRPTIGDPNTTTGANPFGNPLRIGGTQVTSTTTENLPWRNASNVLTGDKRVVNIFVADEADNVDSDVINVYTRNRGADALSGSFTTVWVDTTFLAANWRWSTEGVNAAAATSSGGTGGGFLGLSTGLANPTQGAYYSRWTQWTGDQFNSAIGFVPGVLYCAKMQMRLEASQSSNKGLAPDLRIGVENTAQQLVTTNLLLGQRFNQTTPTDDWNPQLPAVGTNQIYKVYWSPNESLPEYDQLDNVSTYDLRKWRVFFDTVDTDALDSGQWRLNSLVVGTINKPATMAPVAGSSTAYKITDLTTAGGWGYEGTLTQACAVTPTSGGKVSFVASAATATVVPVALWKKLDGPPWMANKLIRATVRLSCPAAQDRTRFASARIRHSTVADWFAVVFNITSMPTLTETTGTNPLMPIASTTATSAYEIMIPSYGAPNSFVDSLLTLGYPTARRFNVAIDHLGKSTADLAHTWVVNEIQYEVLDDPVQ